MKDGFADKWCISFGQSGHEVKVYGNIASSKPLPVVYLSTIAGEGVEIWRQCLQHECADFVLVEVAVGSWNDDLTPWPGPALRRRAEPFGGKADEYLRVLAQSIVPRVERMLAAAPLWRGIAGYSLAGLFALYCVWQTKLFDRVAAMSPSVWYWGFAEYVEESAPVRVPDRVYLSLGDAECKAKDPTLAVVGECLEQMRMLLQRAGAEVAYRAEPGNHFDDPEGRTARGIRALLLERPRLA